jgi:hypothetical protein
MKVLPTERGIARAKVIARAGGWEPFEAIHSVKGVVARGPVTHPCRGGTSSSKMTTDDLPTDRDQFGAGFKVVRQLKPTFRDALTLALAVYPEAKVDLEVSGVVLHPSAPAVPRVEARRIGV